jgi:hypothetical protein
MKFLRLGLIFLLPLHADWTAAMDAFDEGDFEQAYQLFSELRTDIRTSAALEFNLGNTAFRKGRIDLALAHYRRALWLSPHDPDLTANLNRALDATGAEWPELPLSRRLSTPLSHFAWNALWFVLLVLTAVYGCLTRLSPPLKHARAWVYPLAGTLLLTAFLGRWASSPQRMRHEGVLQGGSITARFEPVATSTEHFSLPGGSVVHIQDRARQWVRVRSNDASGWIHRDELLPMIP